MTQIYRITIFADGSLENEIVQNLLALGAKGYTAVDGRGSGQRAIVQNLWGRAEISRIETLAPGPVAQKIINYINRELIEKQPVTVCLDEVKVIRGDHF